MSGEQQAGSITVSFSDECAQKIDQILERCELKEKLAIVQLAIALALLSPVPRSMTPVVRAGRGYTINRGSLDPDSTLTSAIKAAARGTQVDVFEEIRSLGEQGIDMLHSLIVQKHLRLPAAITAVVEQSRARQ